MERGIIVRIVIIVHLLHVILLLPTVTGNIQDAKTVAEVQDAAVPEIDGDPTVPKDLLVIVLLTPPQSFQEVILHVQ